MRRRQEADHGKDGFKTKQKKRLPKEAGVANCVSCRDEEGQKKKKMHDLCL